MASSVEICNRALQLIGASQIVSLTENSRDARAVNLAYEPCLEAELRIRNWNFATKNAVIAALATPPVGGRSNAYQLPSDFVKLLPSYPENNYNDTDWQIEGRTIVSNEDGPLTIRYTALVTDPNVMDSAFREALSARIARDVCEQLTQSNAKLQAVDAAYKAAVDGARIANALENIPVEAAMDTYLSVRR
jgi:hypothetical protein